MKRSEVIETISDLVLNPISGFKLNKEEAKIILDKLEVIGVEPPPHQERRGTGYIDVFGMEETYDEWVQGWEAE